MGIRNVIHYVGSFVILVAMTMTIVVDISAPVNDSIYFLKYEGNGDASARFGVFGYCETTSAGDSSCSDTQMGYNPASVLEDLNAADFSNAREDSTRALTKAFIIHPIGTGLLFIAFLSSFFLATSTIGSIFATLATGIAFIINAIAAILDWVVFSLIRNEVNDSSNNGDARYGSAIYLSVIAAALALIGTIIMFFTCCASRRNRRYENRKMGGY